MEFFKNLSKYSVIKFIAFLIFCGMIYRLLLSVNNNVRIFSFDDFGSSFNSKFGSYGLNRSNDNVKFIFNIRTDEGKDDCKIRGMYKDDRLRSITIDGEGEKCKILRENN
jgi:hypothetical protein